MGFFTSKHYNKDDLRLAPAKTTLSRTVSPVSTSSHSNDKIFNSLSRMPPRQREEWKERIEARRSRSQFGVASYDKRDTSRMTYSTAHHKSGFSESSMNQGHVLNRFKDVSLQDCACDNLNYNDVSSLDMRSVTDSRLDWSNRLDSCFRSINSQNQSYQYDPSSILRHAVEYFEPASRLSRIIVSQFNGRASFESQLGMPTLHFLLLETDAEPSYVKQLIDSETPKSQQSFFDIETLNSEGNSALICLWNKYVKDFGYDLRRANYAECRKIYEFTMILQMFESEVSRQVIESYKVDAWEKFSSGKNNS